MKKVRLIGAGTVKIKLLLMTQTTAEREKPLKFSSNLLLFLSPFVCFGHSLVPERSICTCVN